MTGKKAKPATKKVAAAKADSAVAGKTKTKTKIKTKTGKTAPPLAVGKPVVKKQAARKTGVATAETKKTKALLVKKAVAPVAKKKSAPVKAKVSKAVPAKVDISANHPKPEERYRMVETAAYFIAERHGFQGRSDEHWAAAEREIAARLGK